MLYINYESWKNVKFAIDFQVLTLYIHNVVICIVINFEEWIVLRIITHGEN